MQKKTAKNHIAKLLVLALLTGDTCVAFVHADQDP